jgi:hypothetical protein
MEESIADIVPPIALRDRNDMWWQNTKMSDDFLDRVFDRYFVRRNLPNTFPKGKYYELAKLLAPEELDAEVKKKLDAIFEVASQAKKIL